MRIALLMRKYRRSPRSQTPYTGDCQGSRRAMGLRRAIARGIGWLPLEAKPVPRAIGRDERETDDPVARRLSHRFERRLEILPQLIGHAQLAQRPRCLLASLPVQHDLPFSLRLPARSWAAEQRAPSRLKHGTPLPDAGILRAGAPRERAIRPETILCRRARKTVAPDEKCGTRARAWT